MFDPRSYELQQLYQAERRAEAEQHRLCQMVVAQPAPLKQQALTTLGDALIALGTRLKAQPVSHGLR